MTRNVANRSVLLTPPGAGAIGVIRVTGPDASSIITEVFRPASRGLAETLDTAQAVSGSLFAGNRLRYGRIVLEDEDIDDVIVSRSSTGGPPGFDISAHGGIRVIERILEALERQGASLGDRHDKPPVWSTCNLIDEETVEAMLRAKTERAVRFLAWQHRNLSARLEQVASLSEEDADRARGELEAMLAGYPAAQTLVEGATVTILGAPNSGKSTLFNRLVGRPATIVSPRAGTTRDWVAQSVEMDGVPVRLVDTAGRCAASNYVEYQAMRSGWVVAEQAELCLLALDGSRTLSTADRELAEAWHALPRSLIVITKRDLDQAWEPMVLALGRPEQEDAMLRVSALTGEGIEQLIRTILGSLGMSEAVDTRPCLFTKRQRDIATRDLSDVLIRPQTVASVAVRRMILDLLGEPDRRL